MFCIVPFLFLLFFKINQLCLGLVLQCLWSDLWLCIEHQMVAAYISGVGGGGGNSPRTYICEKMHT